MGKPAARVSDHHMCPQVNPGPVPHVGGPILPMGEPTVLIGKLPAARVGDTALCVGPPDMITTGSTNVLIGKRPAARIGDRTAHGGVIVKGELTVLIGTKSGAGSGFLGADYAPGADNQADTFSRARAGAVPFCEVCNLAQAPGAGPAPQDAADFPPGDDGQQANAFSRARAEATPLVGMCPATKPLASSEDEPLPLFESETGYNMSHGDFSPEFGIDASHTWADSSGKLLGWGGETNYFKLGEGHASASSGLSYAPGEFEATLIKGEAGVSLIETQVGVAGDAGSLTGQAKVVAADMHGKIGVVHNQEETFVGAAVGAKAVVGEVSGKGTLNIPIPWTSRKLVIGAGGQAAIGAQAEAKAALGQNKEYGTYAEIGAKLGLGPAVGANFILGIK